MRWLGIIDGLPVRINIIGIQMGVRYHWHIITIHSTLNYLSCIASVDVFYIVEIFWIFFDLEILAHGSIILIWHWAFSSFCLITDVISAVSLFGIIHSSILLLEPWSISIRSWWYRHISSCLISWLVLNTLSIIRIWSLLSY